MTSSGPGRYSRVTRPDQRPYVARPVRSTPAGPRLSGDPEYRGRHRSHDWVDTGVMTSDDLAAARRRQEPAKGPSSYVVSHLRTLVPLAWGYIITWLLERAPFLPPELAVLATEPTVVAAVTAVVTFVWYALWRWLEPRVPALLVALLLGHPAEPKYPA